MKLAAEALGLPAFDELVFEQQIDRIVAAYPKQLTFIYRDGHTAEYIWEERSRLESWTDEMKKAAGEKTKARKRNTTYGSHQESHEN